MNSPVDLEAQLTSRALTTFAATAAAAAADSKWQSGLKLSDNACHAMITALRRVEGHPFDIMCRLVDASRASGDASLSLSTTAVAPTSSSSSMASTGTPPVTGREQAAAAATSSSSSMAGTPPVTGKEQAAAAAPVTPPISATAAPVDGRLAAQARGKLARVALSRQQTSLSTLKKANAGSSSRLSANKNHQVNDLLHLLRSAAADALGADVDIGTAVLSAIVQLSGLADSESQAQIAGEARVSTRARSDKHGSAGRRGSVGLSLANTSGNMKRGESSRRGRGATNPLSGGFDGFLTLPQLRALTCHVTGVDLSEREGVSLFESLDVGRGVELSTFLDFIGVGEGASRARERPERASYAAKTTVTCVASSPCGSQLAFGSMDKVVRVVDVPNDNEVARYEHSAAVACIALARAPQSDTEPTMDERYRRLGVGGFAPGDIAWLDLASQPAAGARDAQRNTVQRTSPSHARGQTVVHSRATRSTAGSVFSTSSAASSSKPKTWHPVRLYTFDHKADVNAMSASASGNDLAVAGADKKVTLYCLRTGSARYVFSSTATLWTVDLAERTTYDVRLDDGTILNGVDKEHFARVLQDNKSVRSGVRLPPAGQRDVGSAETKVDSSSDDDHNNDGIGDDDDNSDGEDDANGGSDDGDDGDGGDGLGGDSNATVCAGARVELIFNAEVTRVRNLRRLRADGARVAAESDLNVTPDEYFKRKAQGRHAAAHVARSVLRFDVRSLPDSALGFAGGTGHSNVRLSALTPLHQQRMLKTLQVHANEHSARRVENAKRGAVAAKERNTATRTSLTARGKSFVRSTSNLMTSPELSENRPASRVEVVPYPNSQNLTVEDVEGKSSGDTDDMDDDGPSDLNRSPTSDPKGDSKMQRLQWRFRASRNRAHLAADIETLLPPPSEGEHVLVRFRATISAVNHHKIIAFAGATQEIQTWEYDISPPSAESGRHSGIGVANLLQNAGKQLASKGKRLASTGKHTLQKLTSVAFGGSFVASRVASSHFGDGKVGEIPNPGTREKGRFALLRWEKNIGATVFSVSLARSGRRIAAGGAGNSVSVFDLDEGGGIAFSTPVNDTIFGVRLSSDGNVLALAGASKEITTFDCGSGAELFRRQASDRLRAVSMTADGEQVGLLVPIDHAPTNKAFFSRI